MRKITAVLLILTMLLCTAATQGESESRTAPILLTSFDCTDLEGNPVDITLFDGAQLVLLDIWEAWCDWCLLEMPDLCELYELNQDKGFLVVGLSGVASAEGFDAKKRMPCLEHKRASTPLAKFVPLSLILMTAALPPSPPVRPPSRPTAPAA